MRPCLSSRVLVASLTLIWHTFSTVLVTGGFAVAGWLLSSFLDSVERRFDKVDELFKKSDERVDELFKKSDERVDELFKKSDERVDEHFEKVERQLEKLTELLTKRLLK